MSIILFFLVLLVLILVHEWGHFIMAKKTGMRVDEFGIGFPPKLYSVKKGETEYTLNAILIGGFVRIWGENYEDIIETGNSTKETSELSQGFNSRPKWAQMLVLIAGVTMNILLAWLLYSLTFMIGVQTPVDESMATESAELYVTAVKPDSPASVIPVGSVVTTIKSSGLTIENPLPSEFSTFVVDNAPSPVEVSYRIGEDQKTVSLVPVKNLITDQPDRYAIGVSLTLAEIQKQPLFTAIANGFITTWFGFKDIVVYLYSLVGQLFVGEADLSQVAGPVGIVGMVGEAASFGITALFTFVATISLNLAVINLLPFPALDGGRLVFVLIEAVTSRRIPPVWAGRVNMVGFVLLMLLMVVVTYQDIIRIL